MKKSILLALAAFIFSIMVNAQTNEASIKKNEASLKKQESILKKEVKADRKELRKLTGKEVSSKSKEQFAIDFGNITAEKWEKTPYFDEVNFVKEGNSLKAYYDFDSKLVGTVASKEFKDLPSNAQEFINKKYKDYKKGTVLFYKDNEFNDTDLLLYGQQFDDEDNYFVELTKGNEKIVLQVDAPGWVYFFKKLK